MRQVACETAIGVKRSRVAVDFLNLLAKKSPNGAESWSMRTSPANLTCVLQRLRDAEGQLRRRGVLRAWVFGSVARGDATVTSDVDVLVDLDPTIPLSLFDVIRIETYIEDTVGMPVDLVERKTLKPLLSKTVEADRVSAF